MSECGKTPTNPLGYPGPKSARTLARIHGMKRPRVTTNNPDYCGRIAELEAELAAARAENITLREAQKACEDCDGITMKEVAAARAEVERLKKKLEPAHYIDVEKYYNTEEESC